MMENDAPVLVGEPLPATPDRTKNGISSAALKIIALVTMTVDHTAYVVIWALYRANPQVSGLYSLYYLMRFIGRIAFPIYAFMISEGSRYTKQIYKYMARLAVFAVISEIPFNLAFSGTLWAADYQNVFLTLLLGLFACFAVRLMDEYGKPILLSAPFCAVAAAAAGFLQTDYSWYGVVFVWLCAVSFRLKPSKRFWVLMLGLLIVCIPWDFDYTSLSTIDAQTAVDLWLHKFNSLEFFGSIPAVILILNYRGRKGNLHMNKYFFYAYYPAHLLLLVGIKYLITR